MSVTTATRLSSRLIANEPQPADPVRAWLAHLPVDLAPFAAADLVPLKSRSPAEAHAVTRALGCPDMFVIHAPDQQSGESAIALLAELAADRVLVLSPDPVAADRLTSGLAEAGVVRALADDENPIRSSPVVARLTSVALGSGKAEHMRREAAEALAFAEGGWDPAGKIEAIDNEIGDLTAARDRIEFEVRAGHDRSAIAKKEADLAAERCREMASNAEPTGRWSAFVAWLFGRSSAEPNPIEREKERERLAAEIVALTAARDDDVQAELLTRRAPVDSRLRELTAERDRLELAERRLAIARQRVDELSAPDLVRKLLAEPRIVVGTPGSLESDPVYVDERPFALLILDRCEELAETDFLRLSGLAARWVLVGDVLTRARHAEPGVREGNKADYHPERNGRPQGEAFAARIAPLVDREPWTRESDRLVGRLLHPVTATGRQSLMREPLLDRPEIELRFAADGDGEPAVAEVAFPDGTAIADAKAFLFHQLGEVLLHPCGALRWELTSWSIVACWPATETAESEPIWIDLEPGVREKVVCSGRTAFTAAVEFDPSQGWDRERTEAWLAKHYRPESTGRFAALPSAVGAGARRAYRA